MTARETTLLHAIRAAVAESGRAMIWRCNNGVDTARGVRYGLGVGAADLIGLLRPSGRFLALEVKTPEGKQSIQQRLWGEAVRTAGGFYAVVRSIDEALAAIEEASR